MKLAVFIMTRVLWRDRDGDIQRGREIDAEGERDQ